MNNEIDAFILRNWEGDAQFELPTLEACMAKYIELHSTEYSDDYAIIVPFDGEFFGIARDDDWIIISPDGAYFYTYGFDTWIGEAERQALVARLAEQDPGASAVAPVPPPMKDHRANR